jgi:hypothetical protein
MVFTYDYEINHNLTLRNSAGTIIHYYGGSDTRRPLFDTRIDTWRIYYADHAKGIVDQGFAGIFSDNWLRSRSTGDLSLLTTNEFAAVKNGWNTTGEMVKNLIGAKVLIGNSPPDSVFTSRDICMLEDRVNDVLDPGQDRSIPSYLNNSDTAASMGQVVQDTFWDEDMGPFENFRAPLCLLTDNILGLPIRTKQGHNIDDPATISVRNFIQSLGKIGYPTGPRYTDPATGIFMRDFTGGKVLLNNTAGPVTVNLPSGIYTDAYDNVRNQVTLDSVRGIILKKTANSIPLAPSNLTVIDVTHNPNYYVYVTWTDNSTNETGFEIYQSINSTNNWQLIKTPVANCNNYGINTGANPVLGTYYL